MNKCYKLVYREGVGCVPVSENASSVCGGLNHGVVSANFHFLKNSNLVKGRLVTIGFLLALCTPAILSATPTTTTGDGRAKTDNGANLIVGFHNVSVVDAEKSIAIGANDAYGFTKAHGTQSIAIGSNVQATKKQAISIGNDTNATGIGSIAIGSDDMGSESDTGSAIYNSGKIGYRPTLAKATGSVAIGAHSQANGNASLAIGADAMAEQEASFSAMWGSVASGKYSIALGVNSKAKQDNSVAIGSGSEANEVHRDSLTYSINNNGTTSSISQPTTTQTSVSVFSVGSGNNQRQIQNVAAGTISNSSTDAINGSQLFATANTLKAYSDGIGWNIKGNNNTNNNTVETTSKITNNKTVKFVGGGSTTVNISDDSNSNTTTVTISSTGGSGDVKYFSVKSNKEGNKNNDGAKEDESVAIGPDVTTNSQNSVAIGSGINIASSATSSIVIGDNAGKFSGKNKELINSNWVTTSTNVGKYSINIGKNSLASGTSDIAIGYEAIAKGDRAIAIGSSRKGDNDDNKNLKTQVNGSQSIGLGTGIFLNAEQAVAIGNDLEVTGGGAIAIGGDDLGSGQNGSFGYQKTTAEKIGSVAIGVHSQSKGDHSLAIGTGSTANSLNSLAIMWESVASGDNSIAIGNKAIAGVDKQKHSAIALGNSVKATGESSIAIGKESSATSDNSIIVGNNSKISGNSNGSGINNSNSGIFGNNNTVDEFASSDGKKYGSEEGKAYIFGADNTIKNNTKTTVVGISNQIDHAKNSFLLGNNNISQNADRQGINNTQVMGNENTISNVKNSAIIGNKNTKDNSDSTYVIGFENIASNTKHTNILGGKNNASSASNSSIIGESNTNNSQTSHILGNSNKITSSSNSLAFGNSNSITSVSNSIALGVENSISRNNSTAVGYKNTITGENTFVLGNNVTANVSNSVFLGDKSTVTYSNFTNVATSNSNGTTTGGSNGTITKGRINKGTAKEIVYGGETNSADKFAGATSIGGVSVGYSGGERRIMNVAAGEISATSTDAVNGSQLYAVALKNYTPYFSVNSAEDGNYKNDGATGNNAMAIGPNAKATAEKSISLGYQAGAQNDSSIAIGYMAKSKEANAIAIGDNSEASVANSVAIGSGSKTTAVKTDGEFVYEIGNSTTTQSIAGKPTSTTSAFSVGDKDKERQIKNVAAGEVSKNSTDAINGSQLYYTAKNLEDAGLNFSADLPNGIDTLNIKLGKTLKIVGAEFSDGGVSYTNQNLKTRVNPNGSIEIGFSNTPEFESLTLNNTKLSGDNAGNLLVNGKQLATSENVENIVAASKVKYFSVNSTGGGNENNDGATIQDAIAIGKDAKSEGWGAVALGKNAQTTNAAHEAISIGEDSKSSGYANVAIGNEAKAEASKFATAIGFRASAAGNQSTAMGVMAQATGVDSSAYGSQSLASGENATAIGAGSKAQQLGAVALGQNANATNTAYKGIAIGAGSYVGNPTNNNPADQSVPEFGRVTELSEAEDKVPSTEGMNQQNAMAIGMLAKAFGYQDTALGAGAEAYDTNSLAIGIGAQSKGDYSTALGKGSKTFAERAQAMGYFATAKDKDSLALGPVAYAGGVDSVAIGHKAHTEDANSVALGANSFAIGAKDGKAVFSNEDVKKSAGIVSVGNAEMKVTDKDGKETTVPASYRRMINLAGGIDDNDAVNVMQLKAATTGNNDLYEDKKDEAGNPVDEKGNPLVKDEDGKYYPKDENGKPDKSNGPVEPARQLKGLKFVGNEQTAEYRRVLGDEVKILGNEANVAKKADFSDKNVLTENTADGVHIKISDKPEFKEVTVKDGEDGKTTVIKPGDVTVTNGKDGKDGKSSSLTPEGMEVKDGKDGENGKAVYGKDGISITGPKGADGADGKTTTIKVDKDGDVVIGKDGKDGKVVTQPDLTDAINKVGAASKTEVVKGKNTTVEKETAKDGHDIYKVNVEGDLEDIKSISNGDTKVSLDKDAVNVNGAKITNVKAGEADTDAVNVKQLKDSITTINNNVTAAKTEVTGTGAAIVTDSKATDGHTIYNVHVDKPVQFTKADGTPVTKDSDGKFYELTDGKPDKNKEVPAGDIIISMVNPDETSKNSTKLNNVAAGKVADDSTEAVNGSQLKDLADTVGIKPNKEGKFETPTFNKLKDEKGNDDVTAENPTVVSTVNNTIDTVNKGLDFAGNVGNGKQQLGSKVSVVGSEKAQGSTYSSNNITTTYKQNEGNGIITIEMKENPTFAGDVTSKTGIKVENGPSMTTDGIDAANKKITNVADGTDPKDAVNYKQLQDAINSISGNITPELSQVKNDINNLRKDINRLKKGSNAGTASAMAIGNLPQATIPGKGMFAIGTGVYGGQAATAIGISKMSDNGKWVFKGSMSYDSQKNAGAAASIGFHW